MDLRRGLLCFLHVFLVLFARLGQCEAKTVKFLPGFEGPLPFYLETGYLGVGEPDEDRNLFYYFVKSERNPENDPLLVWFTGGPGCSVLSALAFTLGPMQFNREEYKGTLPTLIYNQYTWTKTCSILLIDLPVGTGFSYELSPFQTSDSEQVQHALQFLRKWLDDHEQYHSNSVYVGGDSYSAIIVPSLSLQIAESNEKGIQPLINFQGYMLGNPVITTKHTDKSLLFQFAHGMGLIPLELYESLIKECAAENQFIDSGNMNCLRSMEAFNKSIERINQASILDPLCPDYVALQNLPKGRSLYEMSDLFLKSEPAIPWLTECRHYGYILVEHWANDHNVQIALGVREGTKREWKRCTKTPYEFDIFSSYQFLVKLSKKGYRSLIYSGDHDMLVAHPITQAWIRSLNYSIVDEWRPWFVEDQVAGYTRTYSNRMTFATVKGAGHVAPDYKPKECVSMFERWISGKPL